MDAAKKPLTYYVEVDDVIAAHATTWEAAVQEARIYAAQRGRQVVIWSSAGRAFLNWEVA